MTWNPAEFFEVADSLIKQHPGHGSMRSAISRYYYAAYLSARSHCRRNGFRHDRQRNEHQEIQEYLGVLRLGAIAKDLGYLRDQRNAADYDLELWNSGWNNPIDDVLLARDRATSVINGIRATRST